MSSTGMRWGLFIVIAGFLFFRSLESDYVIRGDSVEYIVQTQSIVLNQQLLIDTASLASYWNTTAPFSQRLKESRKPVIGATLLEKSQAGGGFGSLYPDSRGDYRYIHFWTYSLLASPIYAILHLLDSSQILEYQSFRILNVILLCSPFLILLLRQSSWRSLAIFAFFASSPLGGYTSWHSPEVMCFSFLLSAFLLYDSENKWLGRLAPLLIGLACTHYLPAVFSFAIPALGFYKKEGVRGLLRPDRIIFYSLGIILVLGNPAYYFYYFNTPIVLGKLKLAGLHFSSLSRALDFYFNPFTGGVWYFFPMIAVYLMAWEKENTLIDILALVVCTATAYLCSGVNNFNSASFGCARYVTWAMSPLLFCAIQKVAFIRLRLLTIGVLVISIFIWGAVWRPDKLVFQGIDLTYQDSLRPATAKIIRVTRFPGSPETFAENIGHNDFLAAHHFNGIYIWNISSKKSLWLVSKRAYLSLKYLAMQLPSQCRSKRNRFGRLFGVKDDKLQMLTAKKIRWRKDTYLGGYKYLWLDCPVGEISSNVGVFVR